MHAHRRPERLPTFGKGGIRPGVDLDNSSALLDLMERRGDDGPASSPLPCDPVGAMEPIRTDRHDESLFDTEPSPQPEVIDAAPSAPGMPDSSTTSAPPSADTVTRPAEAPPGDSIADGVERHLHENYIIVHRIVGAIVTAIMALSALVGAFIAILAADLPVWLNALIAVGWVILVATMGWTSWSWPPLEHRWTSYRVGPLGIELRKGVVFRRVITVPRSRIQHTDVSQGPLERQLGLATLHMFTAGTEHSEVDLPGLEHAIALRIRDHLVIGGEDDAV